MKDINAADIKDLQKIKGIGKVTAQNIIEYREEICGFNSLVEVKNVSGVGEKSFSNLKEVMTLDGEANEEIIVTEDNEADKELVRIEFDPYEHNLDQIGEVHLVGDMNNWDPTDKTYALKKEDSGLWANSFDLETGIEYKFMYDADSWEADNHIGYYGGNLTVQK